MNFVNLLFTIENKKLYLCYIDQIYSILLTIVLIASCGKTWSASRPKFYTQSPFTIEHSVSLRSALNKVFFNFLYNREELLSKSLYVRLSAF